MCYHFSVGKDTTFPYTTESWTTPYLMSLLDKSSMEGLAAKGSNLSNWTYRRCGVCVQITELVALRQSTSRNHFLGNSSLSGLDM